MPMDPTLGIRIYQALLQKADLERSRKRDALDAQTIGLQQQQAQQKLDDDKAFESVFKPIRQRLTGAAAPGVPASAPDVQVGFGPGRTRMGPGEGASLQEAMAPAAPAPAAAPQVSAASPTNQPGTWPAGMSAPYIEPVAPLAPADTGPIFKMPKGHLPDAPMSVRSSPARIRAAEDAKATSEAQLGGHVAGVMDLYQRNQDALNGQAEPLSPEEQLVLSAYTPGARIVDAMKHMREQGNENRRAALTGALNEAKAGQENAHHIRTENRMDREARTGEQNAGTAAKRERIAQAELDRRNAVEGKDANEAIDIAGRKKASETAGAFRGQLEGGRIAYETARDALRDANRLAQVREGTRGRLIQQLGDQFGAAKLEGLMGEFDIGLQDGGMFTKPSAVSTRPPGQGGGVPTDYGTQARMMTPQQRAARRAQLLGAK